MSIDKSTPIVLIATTEYILMILVLQQTKERVREGLKNAPAMSQKHGSTEKKERSNHERKIEQNDIRCLLPMRVGG